MSIQVTCDECFTDYKLKEELAGKKVRCKECSAIIKVPAAAVDDLDDYGFDEDEAEEKPRRPPALPGKKSAGSKARRAPADDFEDLPLPKSKGKSKKGSKGPPTWLDRVPNGVAISVMWVTIVGLCTVIAVFGRGAGDAQAFQRFIEQDVGADDGDFEGNQAPLVVAPGTGTLVDARRGFRTQLDDEYQSGEPVEPPPPNIFQVVQYTSPAGQMAAYLTPNPGDGVKRPAIIWITGGECNTIGNVWEPMPPQNDQSAAAYRNLGIVMMFPSLRGGNENPGFQEGFFGEVDDVIAATEYLAQQPHVDPNRIYLGGHSTGGTLALLVAECSDRYRAVFSFGPVHDVRGYGGEFVPVDESKQQEMLLRSPGSWLHCITKPVFVIEGRNGNSEALQAMQRISTSSTIQFLTVEGQDHFSVLGPINQMLAHKILQDIGPTTNLALTAQEVNQAF